MKIKYGFSTYAKNKIPLKNPPIGIATQRTDESTPGLGDLLPNGFRVGERVYYVSPLDNTIVFGIVVNFV